MKKSYPLRSAFAVMERYIFDVVNQKIKNRRRRGNTRIIKNLYMKDGLHHHDCEKADAVAQT